MGTIRKTRKQTPSRKPKRISHSINTTPKKKLTENQKAYKEAVDRLQKRIKSREKQGYIFNTDLIGETPKKIYKKDIEAIEKLRGDKLLKEGQAEWLNTSTGELVSYEIRQETVAKQKVAKAKLTKLSKEPLTNIQGASAEQLAKTEPYIKQEEEHIPTFAQSVINNYLQHLEQLGSAPMYKKLRTWIDVILIKYGVNDTAIMLQHGAEAGNILTWDILYEEQECIRYIAEMTTYMPEMTEQWVKDFMDTLEETGGDSYNV